MIWVKGNNMRLTQQQKILAIMAAMPEKQWWYAPDFQQPHLGDLFVGYEATARMAEVYQKYPTIVGMKREGKYRYICLHHALVPTQWNLLPPEAREALASHKPTSQGAIQRPVKSDTELRRDEPLGIKQVGKGQGFTVYEVPGSHGKIYTVEVDHGAFYRCNCEGYKFSSKKKCKHTDQLAKWLKVQAEKAKSVMQRPLL